MSDIIIATILTIGGMFGVAAVGAWVQVTMTRTLIDAEQRKVLTQAETESNHRIRERDFDRIHDAFSDLLSYADPIVYRGGKSDPNELFRRIGKLWLLLDPKDPTERDIENRLFELGKDLVGKRSEEGDVLGMHHGMLKQARAVLRSRSEQLTK